MQRPSKHPQTNSRTIKDHEANADEWGCGDCINVIAIMTSPSQKHLQFVLSVHFGFAGKEVAKDQPWPADRADLTSNGCEKGAMHGNAIS